MLVDLTESILALFPECSNSSEWFVTMKGLCFLLISISCAASLQLCSNTSQSTQDICAKSLDYNKHRNPDFPDTTRVHMDLIIRDVLQVDEEKHLIEIVAYSNLNWIEPRIDIKSISQTDLQTARPTLEELSQLWLTDVTYANAIWVQKRFHYYTATKDQLGQVWFKLTMLWKFQVTCQMDFSSYPFDSHDCLWKIRSYYENSQTEKLEIASLQNERDFQMATKNEHVVSDTKNLPFIVEMFPGQSGLESIGGENKSIVLVHFKFTRKVSGRYKLITGYYVPTGLFASLSLISYLIKPEIVPGRMGMLVVLFLIFTNIHGTLEGPSSRGFSYIEVWYVGMFTPIVIAIAEYAFILAIMKYQTDTEYEANMIRRRPLKRWIADVDVSFMGLNLCFMIGFVIIYCLK